MEEIGKLLREVRREKNITLDDISQKTKIQKKYLHALEEGDFSIFSGEIYIKGALRNYAQAAGLNADEILTLYNQFKNKQSFVEKNEQQVTKKEQSIYFTRKEKKPFPSVVFIWITLLIFVFAGSIWYLYGQDYQKERKKTYPEGYLLEDAEKQNKSATPSIIPAEEPEKVEEVKELVKIAENGNEIVYALRGVEQMEIILNFPGRCWVRILQDGTQVEEKTFQAGESKSLGDAQETLLHLGNPPAARITVNGLEFDNLTRFTNPVKIIIKKE